MGEKKYNFKRIKTVYITAPEMNKHLAFVKKNRTVVLGPRTSRCRSREIANIELKIVNFHLTYRDNGTTITYVCRLDGEAMKQKKDGLTCFTTMCKYWSAPRLKDEKIFGYHQTTTGKIAWVISPTEQLLYYNKKYNGQRFLNCYGYDMNSAFSRAMLEPIPDTTKLAGIERKIKAGEIGFRLDGEVVFEEGKFANFIFPAMESPYKRFVEIWYNKKMKAKTPEDREKAKEVLNYSVGYLHRRNPFIRNCIVSRCNNLIRSLIDDNTLYCNTDSIVSIGRRPDLEANLGPNVGQWKLEHEGAFAFKEYSYQWNDAEPKYRGIPKKGYKTFKEQNGRAWDILKDPVPQKGNYNVYAFNQKKLCLELVSVGGEDEEI